MSRGTCHAKRIVGVVPVEADGSAHFTVPALRSLGLNLVDREGKVLVAMGSDLQMMPGERRGCIGCHESRERYLTPRAMNRAPEAFTRAPSHPQTPDWGTKGILDFVRVVQPVLVANCVKCHSGPQPASHLDLSNDKTRYFNMAYDNLIQRDLVAYYDMISNHDENSGLFSGSRRSRLLKYIDDSKHSGASISLADRQRIYNWIDLNIPYYSTYTSTESYAKSGDRDAWQSANKNGWFKQQVLPIFQSRCVACHKRFVHPVRTQDYYTTGNLTATSLLWSDTALKGQATGPRVESYLVGPESRINLTHPEWSAMLQAPLAKSAGGWGLCRTTDDKAVIADPNDPDYQKMLQAIRASAFYLEK